MEIIGSIYANPCLTPFLFNTFIIITGYATAPLGSYIVQHFTHLISLFVSTYNFIDLLRCLPRKMEKKKVSIDAKLN